MGPILHFLQSATEVTVSFRLTLFSFPKQRPHCLNSKCTCSPVSTHGCVGLQMKCGQVHWYFETLESNCTFDPQKPALRSVAQCFTVISRVSYHAIKMRLHRLVHEACAPSWSVCMQTETISSAGKRYIIIIIIILVPAHLTFKAHLTLLHVLQKKKRHSWLIKSRYISF